MTIGSEISPGVRRFFTSEKARAIPELCYHAGLSPREHQAAAIEYALDAFGRGSGVFFRVGIGAGKTSIIIHLARALAALGLSRLCIVIAPKTLMGTWVAEIKKHNPDPCEVAKWNAQKAKGEKYQDAYRLAVKSGRLVFFIVNVEAFSRENKELEAMMKMARASGPCSIAIDESTTIKGHAAERSKRVARLAQSLQYRSIMTGTEISKSPLDVFQQCEALGRSMLGYKTHFMFRQHYSVEVTRYMAGGTKQFPEIVGYRDMQGLLDKLSVFSFCRRTDECITLPDQIFETIPIELSSEERRIYNEIKKHLISEMEAGTLLVASKAAAFIKLRQITGGMVIIDGEHACVTEKPSKLVALVDDIETLDADEQAIVFACFRGEIKAIARELSKQGKTVTYYGDDTPKEKDAAITQFQSGSARFFVANPESGGYGLNLQNARLMYFYNKPASLLSYIQAQGRIYRSGQTRKCIYKSILAEDTIDARIEEILEQKGDILAAFQKMTIDDIISL